MEPFYIELRKNSSVYIELQKNSSVLSEHNEMLLPFLTFIMDSIINFVGSQIAAHTLMETGNGPNEPNTINL